ncbi:fungal specific transcription factor domain-containing protein, partial [Metarhizium majus ARSEF 297]
MTNSFNFNNIGQRQDGIDNTNMPSPTSPTQDAGQASSSSHHQSGNVTVYPTIGPDAYTSPILAPGSSGQPALNPRSCVTCRRRKVRCDKQMPCSNCRRAQNPCVFPAPGRAPRQPRPKDPNAPPKTSSHREAELVKRLRKLEGIVEELSGQIDEPAARGPSTTASPDMQSGMEGLSLRHMPGSLDHIAGQEGSPRGTDSSSGHSGEAGRKEKQPNFGRLVSGDQRGTSRYVSSGFWSKLNDELDAIREETQRLTGEEDAEDSDFEGTPTDSPSTGFGNITDHQGFILGYRSADVDLQKCHPLPSHASFLWSVYQENVEPLIKLLHVPSVELIISDARRNHGKLTPGNEALVFAIYFAAITSLEPDEVQANFDANKDDMLAQYRFAVEQSLAKANFLDTSDLAVLQSFTLFLIVVRRHDESRFSWALTGLVIRIAQGMGLHRDGTHLKLSPFETEIRRRIWWAILVLDLRSAEELGTDMTISERSYDTLKPSNINDSDISPGSTEFPVPREGRSDCAVSIVRCEICGLSRRLVAAASAMSSLCPGVDQSSIAERERMLIEVYQRVEHKFLQHVLDETDPLYWVAAMIARVIVAKMCLVIYHPMLFPGSEYELTDEIRQRIYVAAIEVIEYGHKLNTDPRCKQYRWLFKTYTNWHAIAYTLIETCRRPWTALVERGWDAINGYDIDPLELAKRADHAAVFLPLRKLFAKARKHRESELARLKANQDEARRLDFAERMNPAQARFGPVPGAENVMEQMREKWWSLVRPDGSSPMPSYSIARQPAPPQEPASATTASGNDTLKPPGNISVQLNLSSAAMEYMDELMAQPNPNMAEFWRIDNIANNGGNLGSSGSAPSAPMPLQNEMSEDILRQQALMLQAQPPKDDGLTPYLWSDPFTAMNTKFDVTEDADMLGDDFDWQDWSQSIRGLEMGSTQKHEGW